MISVCRSSPSSCATAAGSLPSTKMYDDSGLPRSGVITASACLKVAATIGSIARRSSFGAAPRPRNAPCWRSMRNSAALPRSSAATSFSSLAASSAASPKSTAARTADDPISGRGGAGIGTRPARASASARASCAARSASSRPPSTSAPRSGALPGTAATLAAAEGTGDAEEGEGAALAAAPIAWTRGAGLCRPGTCSSSTTWKLVPPKPNALTPPRRMPHGGVGHSRNAVLTLNGERSQSTFGFGSRKLRLGASTFSCRLIAILNMPAVPAAALRCPMFDFTDPSATPCTGAPAAPNTAVRLSSSVASPTRVDVPCASIDETVPGSTAARSQARCTASRWPIGLGAVMPLPLPSLDPSMPRITA